MLGNKKEKTKDLIRKLEDREVLFANCKAELEEVAGLKESGTECFPQITAGQAELDKGLTKVVACVKAARQSTEEEIAEAEAIRSQTEEIYTQMKHSEDCVRSFAEHARKEQDEFTDIVERNKHFTTPAKNLASEASGLKVELESLKNELISLKDYFRSIGVMSLHSAIEAGRIGETGKKFVAASEDMRVLSEEKEHGLEEVLNHIGIMSDRIDGIDEQVGKLNSLLKENNVSMGRMRKEHEGRIHEFEASGYKEHSMNLQELTCQMVSLKEYQKTIWENENAAMDEMENIGAGFMEDKNAAREAETVFRKTMEKARHMNHAK